MEPDQLHDLTRSALAANKVKIDRLIELSRGYHIALLALLIALQKEGVLTRETACHVLEAALLALPADRQQSATATVLMNVADLLKAPIARDGEAMTAGRTIPDLAKLFDSLTASIVD